MRTPIPQILLAYEGRVDFLCKTNPFGGSGKKEAIAKPASDALNAQRTQLAFAKLEAKQAHKVKNG